MKLNEGIGHVLLVTTDFGVAFAPLAEFAFKGGLKLLIRALVR
jgi:hypothetical protein